MENKRHNLNGTPNIPKKILQNHSKTTKTRKNKRILQFIIPPKSEGLNMDNTIITAMQTLTEILLPEIATYYLIFKIKRRPKP
jgi:hypothetical protein